MKNRSRYIFMGIVLFAICGFGNEKAYFKGEFTFFKKPKLVIDGRLFDVGYVAPSKTVIRAMSDNEAAVPLLKKARTYSFSGLGLMGLGLLGLITGTPSTMVLGAAGIGVGVYFTAESLDLMREAMSVYNDKNDLPESFSLMYQFTF